METYLYIKQHLLTGKLYFGKTTKNPEIYKGSGKHWLRHINKHGTEYVTTLWYCLFLDKITINNFAINFSTQNDIVNSDKWLNLCIENGEDGGKRNCPNNGGYRKNSGRKSGFSMTQNHKDKISKNNGMNIKCSCINCHKIISSALLKRHEKSCQHQVGA